MHVVAEIRLESSVFVDRPPDVLGHLLFLFGDDALVELVRVDRRHEDDAVALEMVLCEVRVVPDLHVTVFVEADHGIFDLEGS